MDEKLISASRTIKDLGIIFEDNFKFKEHMGIIFNNANSILGIIKNTFHELTIDHFIILYKALVRPILDRYHRSCPNVVRLLITPRVLSDHRPTLYSLYVG